MFFPTFRGSGNPWLEPLNEALHEVPRERFYEA